MSERLRIAVVGHTNTGKTSLLRTLMRDVEFGDVSDRPAVTRHVEGTVLHVGGAPLVELYDTPGLEDSIGLLDTLDMQGGGQRRDGIETIETFLESDAATTTFSQEAKALRQVLECDVAMYVIDARDRVLGKHRDELEILARCARPVVPVLNFVASDEAKTDAWRDQLARVNLHAVASFDTVVYDEAGERRLFEKIASLADAHRSILERLVEERVRQRDELRRAAYEMIGDLLIDVAAAVRVVEAENDTKQATARDALQADVRDREQRCVEQLLELFRFRIEDCAAGDLPLEDGRWGLDLFSPEALKQTGVRAGSAAAAGALAGLALDAMSAGLTLGTATATGAAIGAVFGAGRGRARRLVDRIRGMTELRVADTTLRVLAARQVHLLHALLRRGHAAQDRIAIDTDGAPADVLPRQMPKPIRTARTHTHWCTIEAAPQSGAGDLARHEAVTSLAETLRAER